jgi:tRNA U55 pseudouridine synthase TruB
LRVSEAITLAQLKTRFAEEALGTALLSPDAALSRLPFVHLSAEDARRARHGMEVSVSEAPWPDGAQIRMRDIDGQLIAVGYFTVSTRSLHPRVVIAQEK